MRSRSESRDKRIMPGHVDRIDVDHHSSAVFSLSCPFFGVRDGPWPRVIDCLVARELSMSVRNNTKSARSRTRCRRRAGRRRAGADRPLASRKPESTTLTVRSTDGTSSKVESQRASADCGCRHSTEGTSRHLAGRKNRHSCSSDEDKSAAGHRQRLLDSPCSVQCDGVAIFRRPASAGSAEAPSRRSAGRFASKC